MGFEARLDSLIEYLQNKIDKSMLVDVDHNKIFPTWRNHHTREDRVVQIIHRFIIFEALLNIFNLIKQWVGMRGDTDHSLIFLNVKGAFMNLANSLKMNSNWLKEEEFINLVKYHWKTFNP